MFIAIFHCAAGTSLLKSEDFEERSIVGYQNGVKEYFRHCFSIRLQLRELLVFSVSMIFAVFQ